VQLRASGKADEDQGMSNYLEPAALNDVDQRVLKECFRVLRRLQQRMSLDYQR
jgi:CBS domain-containing protein